MSLAKKDRRKERQRYATQMQTMNGWSRKHKQGLGGSLVNALTHVALINGSDWLERLGGVTVGTLLGVPLRTLRIDHCSTR